MLLGRALGLNWLSDTLELALTFNQVRFINDTQCSKMIVMTDQGIPVTIGKTFMSTIQTFYREKAKLKMPKRRSIRTMYSEMDQEQLDASEMVKAVSNDPLFVAFYQIMFGSVSDF